MLQHHEGIDLLRTDALEILVKYKADAISIVTMQSVYPWHELGGARSAHIDATGCMGSASSLGLGLAIGNPERPIWVLDGDGSLLMQLGTLVTISGLAPENFYHFIFSNGLYQSTGNQPLPGQSKFDLCGMAISAGYSFAVRYAETAEFERELEEIINFKGPGFIELIIDPEPGPPRWAGIKMADQVKKLQAELSNSDAK